MRRLILRQIAALCGGSCALDIAPAGYSVDSRQVKAGELFFALTGARSDGHDFLGQVAAAGVCGAVVSRAYQGPSYGLPLIPVDDVLAALQKLARHSLREGSSKVVAVTGSVGKTTTKEFLRIFLSQRYKVAASPGNSNSQIGLPLTILNHTSGDEDLVILEMGMTLPGHIAKLLTIAPPDVALITTVALAHAGNFESLEHIARTKAEIFGSPKTRLGLLPREVAAYPELCTMGCCEKRSFSARLPDADYYVRQEQGELVVVTAGQAHRLGRLPLPGAHNVHNFLAAAATARELQVPWEAISAALPLLELPERRLQKIEKRGITFINDSYNAPPAAVQAALVSLPAPPAGGRRVAVLGPMPELGKFSAACHREVGEVALKAVDELFCLGEECRPLFEVWQRAGRPAAWFLDRSELSAALRSGLRAGDVVLIKGANVKQMWQLVDEVADV